MKSTTSAATVKEVRKLFAQFGLPHQLVTDNGPQFVSNEFEAFLKSNGVKHVLSAPYHPATNGQAERLVQSFKQSMRASENSDGNVEKKVAQFLLAYRAAPHCVTNETPAKLFLGRELRTRLDLLKPDIQSVMSTKLLSQSGNMTETRQVDGKVWVRDYRGADKWVPGQVTAQHGERHYDVDVVNGQCRRHIDQLRSREEHNISLQIEPDLPERCAAPTRDSNHASVSCGETSSLEPVLQPTPRRLKQDNPGPPDRLNLYLGNI
ncbi:uncharacterized protein K02A2.6-like [Haliotis rubra]|uniref:uncharacterized protein K02A2.6-like n=1 Tax=Haliotis rubra TaxID=36100 RepID=UPI001EE6240D|nr:uncharacterized protein K02A2.6-like [Haliotis rubra]